MKKRYAVTFVSLLLIAAMAMSLGGCGVIPTKYIEAKMVRYLNKKYPEDHFRYEKSVGGAPLGGLVEVEAVTNIHCSSRNYPEFCIEVAYIRETREYCDNYLGIKYVKEMDDYASALIQEFFPEHKMDYYSFYESAINCEIDCSTLPADSTFEEYLAGCNEILMMAVEYPEDELDKETIQDTIASILEEKDVGYFAVRIFFVEALDPSEKYTRYSYNELDVFFDDDNSIERVEWEN